jgi:hypothetical protein
MLPFRRASVLAGMLETFDAAPQKAVEFWTGVCTGLNLGEKTDPRYKLRTALQTSTVMSANSGSKKRVDAETMYRWGIFAWNMWRKGAPMQVLRAPAGTKRPRATKKSGKFVSEDGTAEA